MEIPLRVIESGTDEQIIISRWITPIAIPMIVLGIIAIAFSFFASIASTLVFGWLFIAAGVTQIVLL
jgi:uncharacterized membrane protein HdeD (DUF308 family)